MTDATGERRRERHEPIEERFERILAGATTAETTLLEWVEIAERWRIRQALRECRGNRSATARRLGIGRRTLYTKMERLGIEPEGRTRR